jgi:hypothetical protein
MGIGPGAAGLLGGMTGGIAQAYATMGKCLFFSWFTLSNLHSDPQVLQLA